MENILAILVVLALVGVFWFFLTRIIKHREEKARAIEERQELIRKHMVKISEENNQRAASLANAIKNTAVTPKKVETPVKPTYVPSPTQSVNSHDDNFLSDVAMGMVINSLLNSHRDSQSGTVTEDRSTGSVSVKVNESSWGFEDSDSRKSVSDTFSSSSSSDSWSSSDSGPSSDW